MREYFLSQILKNESDSQFLDIVSLRDIMLKLARKKSRILRRENWISSVSIQSVFFSLLRDAFKFNKKSAKWTFK